jgi:hypothetical protein
MAERQRHGPINGQNLLNGEHKELIVEIDNDQIVSNVKTLQKNITEPIVYSAESALDYFTRLRNEGKSNIKD